MKDRIFWYEDSNMNTAGGFQPDFTEIITDPYKWEMLRNNLSVYLVRGNTLSNIINQEGESYIEDHFAPVLAGSGLSLAIDNQQPGRVSFTSWYLRIRDKVFP